MKLNEYRVFCGTEEDFRMLVGLATGGDNDDVVLSKIKEYTSNRETAKKME